MSNSRASVRPPDPHPSGAQPPALPAEVVPKHVAVIMDGNGRWAKERGLPRTEGHKMGEASLPTYFIKNAAKMVSDRCIVHYNLHLKQEVESRDWLPSGDITVGITAGASCPNNLIEDAIRRLFELRDISVQALLKN